MPSFSQRMGLKPLEKTLQLKSLDQEARTGIIDVIYHVIYADHQIAPMYELEDRIFYRLWTGYFKQPADSIGKFNREKKYEFLRKYIYECDWNEAYDFIEEILKIIRTNTFGWDTDNDFGWFDLIQTSINAILVRENSAYRLVDGLVSEITNETEIQEIEEAAKSSSGGVAEHLSKASGFLWDRKRPDYGNSIKESISAVESMCRALTGDNSATLGKCLTELERRTPIHGAFKEALSKLYGYTSDQEGIRHSLTEDSRTPSFAEAKFMLVTCSAFINFLKEAYPSR